MNKFYFLLLTLVSLQARALDGNHFTITRITAPYFIVDGNTPTSVTSAYVGFEVRNNSNSATTYSGLQFAVTSIGTSVSGQNYTMVAPATGLVNIGTLTPGQSKVCYFYVNYPAHTTAQATFNCLLSDNTAGTKTQNFTIANRSSISANAGGTATQSFTNQDIIGGLIYDDVTYTVGNVQNGDESDFQVAVSPQFDPTKISLLGTAVTASNVPGINVGSTDSLYFITGNGSNGATITIRWTFRISGFNFTNFLLPCAGATSGATNYKYTLNTSLGSGTPVTVSSSANPLTIVKTSDKPAYLVNSTAIFTVTIGNPGLYDVTIDKITDQLPAGFTFGSIDVTSDVKASNSTRVPSGGSSGTITFDGGVSSGNTSYYVPAGGNVSLRYTATAPATPALNLSTTAKDYVGTTEVGAAVNVVSVVNVLPLTLTRFNGNWQGSNVKLNWEMEVTNEDYDVTIERSGDGAVFVPLYTFTTQHAVSTTVSGSFVDLSPAAGMNQYRLKLVNAQGQISYSTVISLHQKQTGMAIQSVFPNPFSKALNVQLYAEKSHPVDLEILDMQGHAVYRSAYDCIPGVNTLRLQDLSALTKGFYILRLTDGVKLLQQQLVRVP